LEAQIKLAQQQCLNTYQAVNTVAANYIHWNKGVGGPTNFELSKYNDYIEIVKDQINCATEASEILQRSYRDLQNIDIPGANQRRAQMNNAQMNQNNNRNQQISQSASSPASAVGAGSGGPASQGPVGSPAVAQPATPAS